MSFGLRQLWPVLESKFSFPLVRIYFRVLLKIVLEKIKEMCSETINIDKVILITICWTIARMTNAKVLILSFKATKTLVVPQIFFRSLFRINLAIIS